MGWGDPTIYLYCDGEGCDAYDEFGLTPLAGRGWDDRSLDRSACRAGWTTDGAKWWCEDCVARWHKPVEGA